METAPKGQQQIAQGNALGHWELRDQLNHDAPQGQQQIAQGNALGHWELRDQLNHDAPKGQQLLAQGTALGNGVLSLLLTPRRGKSKTKSCLNLYVRFIYM